jgi:hypothetical protein
MSISTSNTDFLYKAQPCVDEAQLCIRQQHDVQCRNVTSQRSAHGSQLCVSKTRRAIPDVKDLKISA